MEGWKPTSESDGINRDFCMLLHGGSASQQRDGGNGGHE